MLKDELKAMLIQAKYDYDVCKEIEHIIAKLMNDIKKTSKIILESSDKIVNDICVDKIDKLVIRIKDEENKVDKCIERKNRIEYLIAQIDQPYSAVLYMRYVSFHDFKKIADLLNYSDKRIYQLHNLALDLLDEILVKNKD